jgi:hypothetical protein
VARFSNPKNAIDMTADLRPDGTYEVVMVCGAGLPKGTYRLTLTVQPGKNSFDIDMRP